MKKSVLILAFAAFFGVATFASEKNVTQNPVQTEQQQEQMRQDKKKDQKLHNDMQNQHKSEMDSKVNEIKVDEVPEAVQKAALQADTNSIIESAETKVLATGETVYKLTINSALSGETTKTFHANGTEYTDDKSSEEDYDRVR